MYDYYAQKVQDFWTHLSLLSTQMFFPLKVMKKPTPWKSWITRLQIVQFAFSFCCLCVTAYLVKSCSLLFCVSRMWLCALVLFRLKCKGKHALALPSQRFILCCSMGFSIWPFFGHLWEWLRKISKETTPKRWSETHDMCLETAFFRLSFFWLYKRAACLASPAGALLTFDYAIRFT